MLREITKDIGRFKCGQTRDYPKDVWATIERQAHMKLDDFSRAVSLNPALHSPLKGRAAQPRQRLGT